MSYQDFLRATSNPERSNNPSPAPVIYRKPPPSYAALPINTSPGTVHKTVTQYNNLRSASMSSYGPSTSPSISNGSHSHSPARVTSPTTVTSLTEPLPASASTPNPPPTTQTQSSPTSTATPTTTVTTYPSEPPIPQPTPSQSTQPASPWSPTLQTCLTLQTTATTLHSKRPFAALLLAPDTTTVLQTHLSISHIQHAESELARLASIQYSPSYLAQCTLVTTWEPCAMCAGTIYWSRIGRVVYAASEKALRELTGLGNGENLTMDLPCRAVFQAGQTNTEVIGPVSGWEEKVVEESRKWWRGHFAAVPGVASAGAGYAGVGDGGSVRSAAVSTRSTSLGAAAVVTNPVPDEGVLSRIGEDGEYKADLKVDWMMR